MASVQQFQQPTLIYNVPFRLTYGKQYLVKATNPPNQITLGIKMWYSGAQYQFNVLSGGSIVLDGSHIMEVQLLTNISGVIITEGANNLPARDDMYNRNPSHAVVSTNATNVPTGTAQTNMGSYTVPTMRKFEGELYFFIGPTTSTALTGQAYMQMNFNNFPYGQPFYIEANAGSVLPIIFTRQVKLLAGDNVVLQWANASGQTLVMEMTLFGIESDV